jgi:hypothetical protein
LDPINGKRLLSERDQLCYRVSLHGPSGALGHELLVPADETLHGLRWRLHKLLALEEDAFAIVQGTRVWFDCHARTRRYRQVWMAAHEGAARASLFLDPLSEMGSSVTKVAYSMAAHGVHSLYSEEDYLKGGRARMSRPGFVDQDMRVIPLQLTLLRHPPDIATVIADIVRYQDLLTDRLAPWRELSAVWGCHKIAALHAVLAHEESWLYLDEHLKNDPEATWGA